MKKRVLGIVAASALAVAAIGAPVAADANPDSAAGACPELRKGEAVQGTLEFTKDFADLIGAPHGQVLVKTGLQPGQLITEFCVAAQQDPA